MATPHFYRRCNQLLNEVTHDEAYISCKCMIMSVLVYEIELVFANKCMTSLNGPAY